MGKTYAAITPQISDWIKRQHVFFVATAPLDAAHHVNVSPKGLDTFRILGDSNVAYLDYTGSGAETIAHLRENGRITLMFCAFQGPPKIVRLHGRGRVIAPLSAEGKELASLFASTEEPRSYIVVEVKRVSDSCGFGVPFMAYERDRDSMAKWADGKSAQDLADYRRRKTQPASTAFRPGTNLDRQVSRTRSRVRRDCRTTTISRKMPRTTDCQ